MIAWKEKSVYFMTSNSTEDASSLVFINLFIFIKLTIKNWIKIDQLGMLLVGVIIVVIIVVIVIVKRGKQSQLSWSLTTYIWRVSEPAKNLTEICLFSDFSFDTITFAPFV